MTAGRRSARSIKVSESVLDAASDAAEMRGIGTDPFVEALLLGALRRADVDALIADAHRADPDLAVRMDRRRARRGPRWTTIGSPGPDSSSVWTTPDGRWFLRYKGNAKAAKAHRPGEGWHLYVGTLAEPGEFVGWSRREAMATADPIISRAEAAESRRGRR